MGSLFVFVGAFGRWVNPVALVIAYGVANIAAAIPLTPGGLGVVEATVSGILVGFGTRGRSPSGASSVGGWSISGCPSRRRCRLPVAEGHPPATTRPAWRLAGLFGGRVGAGSSSCSPGRAHPGRQWPVPLREQPRGRRRTGPQGPL